MYLETIESFLVQAEDLYRSNPLKTRYSIKYRHCDGKLVVKVTDDVTVRVSLLKKDMDTFVCLSVEEQASKGHVQHWLLCFLWYMLCSVFSIRLISRLT